VLLICSGPDTWRARQKARELLDAFKAKHDKTGFSTEVIIGEDLGYVLSLIGTPSIFCPKRLIRFDGLLDGVKTSELRMLAKRLKEDGDNNIILTVEEEPPTEKILTELKEIKVFQYPFPLTEGLKFVQWCQDQAKAMDVGKAKATEAANRCQGDSWMAMNELAKLSANENAPWAELEYESGSVYEVIDAYFMNKADWREQVRSRSDEQISSVVMNQAKSAIKVKDNAPMKIPYFAVKKMQNYVKTRVAKSVYSGIAALVGSRSGLMVQDEVDSLL